MRFLLQISKGIDTLNNWVGRTIMWLALLMVILGAYNAFTRVIDKQYKTQLSTNTWMELQWYLFSAVFLLMVGYVMLHNGHVRVDVFYARMSAHRKAWVDMLGALLFVIPLSLFLLYVATPWAASSFGWFAPSGHWEISPNPGGLLLWPVKVLVIPGFALLALQALSEAIKNFAFLRGAIATPAYEPKGEMP